ncbi:MAG: DUF3617 family protein [Burkholderiales bacterium]|nr:DUF3617 family protein [Burkholderiales bacterium]
MPSFPRLSATRRIAGVLAMAALAASVTALAQPKTFKSGPGPDELWDITMKVEMAGMPMAMPAQTMQMCIKKDRRAESAVPQQENCRTTDMKIFGNRVTFKMVCTGDPPMSGSGDITSTATTYEGTMSMKSTRRGEEMEMTQKFSGRKVGTCTDQSEQMVASAKAAGDAQVAQICSLGMEQLQSVYFVGKNAACANQQKAFCDKVGGIAREVHDPAAHRRATSTYKTTIADAFKACGQDFAAVTTQACTKAAGARDWAFVGGGYCDAEVRAVGDANCRGRSFTGMDRNLVPLCTRYANLSRGGGATAAGTDSFAPASAQPRPAQQPAAQAQQPAAQPPAQSDPVKQGLDALRKLF